MMAGRRKKTDKTKASKQQRLIFMIKYLIDEWLTMEEIPFSWLVDIYKYEFGYGKDNEDTIEVAIKRDLILLLKQGFIEQKNKKNTLSKAPIKVTERLNNIWEHFEHKNKKLKKFLENKHKNEKDDDIKENKIYEDFIDESISAFDVAVQMVQVIMLREMDIEKEMINQSNRHFFPFDVVVASNCQEENLP